MKIAFAGKGGVGKTTLTAWMGDRLARTGHDVWLVDADTALSLGVACGLSPEQLPEALTRSEELIRERIGSGIMCLNPDLTDLPNRLAVDVPTVGPVETGPGAKRLLLMGRVEEGGGGCACGANALLKAFLAHMFFAEQGHVLVDLEAGVEHLGRGTAGAADGLVVVSEPSLRSLLTAAEVSRLARQIGLQNQVLVINRYTGPMETDGLTPALNLPTPPAMGLFGGASGVTSGVVSDLPLPAPSVDGNEATSVPGRTETATLADLPQRRFAMPALTALQNRQWSNGCVLFDASEPEALALTDALCDRLLQTLAAGEAGPHPA